MTRLGRWRKGGETSFIMDMKAGNMAPESRWAWETKRRLRTKYSEVTAKSLVNQTLDFYIVLVI